jgi:predicted branched-subunit amino acid permease
MVASGVPPLAAMAMSLLVFAGASMIASAQLLASGTPALMIIVATLFINLRFMMYSASLRQHFAHLPLRWRLAVGYLLADNAYGVMLARYAEHPDDPSKLEYYLGASFLVWATWQVAVLGGILIGAGVPTSWRLEFAAPLAFIALTAPFLRERAMIAAGVASAVVVVAAYDMPLRLSIITAALIGIGTGLLFERKPAA